MSRCLGLVMTSARDKKTDPSRELYNMPTVEPECPSASRGVQSYVPRPTSTATTATYDPTPIARPVHGCGDPESRRYLESATRLRPRHRQQPQDLQTGFRVDVKNDLVSSTINSRRVLTGVSKSRHRVDRSRVRRRHASLRRVDTVPRLVTAILLLQRMDTEIATRTRFLVAIAMRISAKKLLNA